MHNAFLRMKLNRIFRVFEPLPTLIILGMALPFLTLGLVEASKTHRMVNSYATASGTVIENEYWSRKDPSNSSKVYWTYHPVVFIAIGLLPILGFGGWSIWRFLRAEREFQAARNARLRDGP